MTGANSSSAKFFINALAELPVDVAEELVPQVREVALNNQKTPSYIRFLTKAKAYSQILQVRPSRRVVKEAERERKRWI